MIAISNLRKKKDIDIIAKDYADYYSDSVLQEKWNKESVVRLFKYFYNQNNDLFFVAYDEDKPVGVVMSVLKPWWDGNHLEDGELFVIPKYRNGIVAKMLVNALFTRAVEKYNATILEAHTYEDEKGFPYSLYKRLGFETVNDLKIVRGNIKEIIKKFNKIYT